MIEPLVTAPCASLAELQAQSIPHDLYAQDVIDVGGYDGSWYDLCRERGSFRFTVVDNRQYRQYDLADPIERKFIEYEWVDVRDYKGKADLVLCFNMLYHTDRHSDVIHKLKDMTKKTLCVVTWVELESEFSTYHPENAHPTDKTIYWIPTPSHLVETFENAGFSCVWHNLSGNRMALRLEPRKRWPTLWP